MRGAKGCGLSTLHIYVHEAPCTAWVAHPTVEPGNSILSQELGHYHPKKRACKGNIGSGVFSQERASCRHQYNQRPEAGGQAKGNRKHSPPSHPADTILSARRNYEDECERGQVGTHASCAHALMLKSGQHQKMAHSEDRGAKKYRFHFSGFCCAGKNTLPKT